MMVPSNDELITPIPEILAYLRKEMRVETDKEVFDACFRKHGMNPEGEHGCFIANGQAFLPPCVEREYLERIAGITR
jgi:hypothetical protein